MSSGCRSNSPPRRRRLSRSTRKDGPCSTACSSRPTMAGRGSEPDLQAGPQVGVGRRAGHRRVPRLGRRPGGWLHPLFQRRSGDGDGATLLRRSPGPDGPCRPRRIARRGAEVGAVSRRGSVSPPVRAAGPRLGDRSATGAPRTEWPARSGRPVVMSALHAFASRALRRIDPEDAHGLAIMALKAGLGPRPRPLHGAALEVEVGGLRLMNPVGLAAGFDKNAQVPNAMLAAGFGFVECGTVTPVAQVGNPRPRLFRLTEDRAVINRLGFNNEGIEAFAARLASRRPGGIVGANIGANKDAADRVAD